MKSIVISIILFFSTTCNFAQDYLQLLQNNKDSNNNSPSLFAPGFISDSLPNRDLAISPKGDEIFYCIYTPDYQYSVIVYTRFKDGVWTKPQVAPFSNDTRYKYVEPAFNHDGSALFFSSNMPSGREGEPLNNDIWIVRREGNNWGIPVNIGYPINTDGGEYFPSLTKDGSVYFTRNNKNEKTSYIFKSAFKNGVYSDPIKLSDEINCGTNRYNAFVSPDETFIVIPAEGVEKGVNGTNYYISFCNGKKGWSKPVNMGPILNTNPGKGWSFSISPDMKYLFFMATRKSEYKDINDSLSVNYIKEMLSEPENGFSDIYWINSGLINKLNNKKLNKDDMTNKDIYSSNSDGSLIIPFSFKLDLMSQLMLVPFEKDPDIYYNQFEIQQSVCEGGNGTIAIIGYKLDGSADVYYQTDYPLASQSSILNNAKFIITKFEKSQFSFSPSDLNVDIVFNDIYGRSVILKATEINRDSKKPFTLLAPVGVISQNPKSLPVYFMNQMSFARKNYTKIEISVDGITHKPDIFKLPIDNSNNYFARYSLDSFNVDFNPDNESDISLINTLSKSHITDNSIQYEIKRNQSHPEIRKISINKEKHSLSVEFSPPFPDIISLKDGTHVSGTFSIKSAPNSGVVNGSYWLCREGKEFSVKLHPDKGWIPNENRLLIRLMLKMVKPFKEWPKSYVWDSKIIKVDDKVYKQTSHWHRL